MNANQLAALHDEERRLWAKKDDADLDVAIAKRNGSSARSGADGGDEAARAAAVKELADAEARLAATLSEWSASYQIAKVETRRFLEAQGLKPDRFRALLG